MNFKIHRGTKEIGGSCVEIWTESTRIVVDFGTRVITGFALDIGQIPLKACLSDFHFAI